MRTLPEEFETKSIKSIENALDAAHVYNSKLTSTAIPVVNRIKEFIPDDTSRSKVFHYIRIFNEIRLLSMTIFYSTIH